MSLEGLYNFHGGNKTHYAINTDLFVSVRVMVSMSSSYERKGAGSLTHEGSYPENKSVPVAE